MRKTKPFGLFIVALLLHMSNTAQTVITTPSDSNAIMIPIGPPHTSTTLSHIELSTSKLFLDSWNSSSEAFD